jgi:hypothetical protein
MRTLALIALLSCSPPEPELQPFQLEAWDRFPTDDQIVAAIVGTGGSSAERADASDIARELLLPSVRRSARSLSGIKSQLVLLRNRYNQDDGDRREVLLRMGLTRALGHLNGRSRRLAESFVKQLHLPDANLRSLDPSERRAEIFAIIEELTRLEQRYGDRVSVFDPREVSFQNSDLAMQRLVLLIRNDLFVGATGDITTTNGSVREALQARGIVTHMVPYEQPW